VLIKDKMILQYS